MSLCNLDITKETVVHLDHAPRTLKGRVLQVRMGPVKKLGDEKSGIFKTECPGPMFVGPTGLSGDGHVYHTHGGTERALLQYNGGHYADWREEPSPKPQLFDFGAFGENIVGANMSENNVCVGDLFRIGKDIIVEVSEPRNPCYKLNIRFEWARALKRASRTGRVGWLYRVLRSGYIHKGDEIVLLERPFPMWSLLNVKRALQGKSVALPLVQELAELPPLTDMVKTFAAERLYAMRKSYTCIYSRYVTARVKHLKFELREPVTISCPAFQPFSFAQIEFGPSGEWRRSYSIVSGDLNGFSIGVALDDKSRGGSRYIHETMKVGDVIKMAPMSSAQATEDEEYCCNNYDQLRRIAIIGGIGVTAFVPLAREWDANNLDYEIHFAVRSITDAPFVDEFCATKMLLYPRSEHKRLNIDDIIPVPSADGVFSAKLYCCGPKTLMEGVRKRAQELEYPDHLLHFEAFGEGGAGSSKGPAFEVQVNDLDTGKEALLSVTPEKTLLQTLRETGFDVTSFCEAGGCGACRVTLCDGRVNHTGTGLPQRDRPVAMLACVDRGEGQIKIELD